MPFDAEDIMFYWDDNVLDPKVTPLNGDSPRKPSASARRSKRSTTTPSSGPSRTAFPTQYLYAMAYGTFCPGPAHILKPQHPKNSKNTYDQYKNAFPPSYMNMPVMGAWVVVELPPRRHHRAAPQSLLLEGRREPATSCPTSTRCTTGSRPGPTATCRPWPAPATSPTSSSPKTTSKALKKARRSRCSGPARLRPAHHRLFAAFQPSANGWGEPDDRAQAVRELNRNIGLPQGRDHRCSTASAFGESLVKGPFTAIYPGGIYAGTTYYDKDSTVYYPFDLEAARAELEARA